MPSVTLDLPLYDAASFRARVLADRCRGGPVPPEAEAAARAVLEAVARDGDAALRRLTARFDGIEIGEIEVSPVEIERAAGRVPRDLAWAIDAAAEEIEAYHRRQLEDGYVLVGEGGARAALRVLPLRRVGIYVPGGRAVYPSSLLMCALPARVAGVEEIVACTPPGPDGQVAPAVAYAALRVGIARLFRLGGAQAVAAMALGTATVPRVDKIVGPGNAYVTAAKRLVFGQVGIDSLAGPSEVALIADAAADPEWIALDLLAQAEHGPDTVAVLFSPDESLLHAVRSAVARLGPALGRTEVLARALRSGAAAVLTSSLEEAAALADELAPEHLSVWTADGEALARRVRTAAAVYVGPWAPVALGDYAAGPNHVLPTGGSARYFSPLSVQDFLRRQSVYTGSAAAFARLGPAAARLAEAEGLPAHAASLRRRLVRLGPGEEGVGRGRSAPASGRRVGGP